MALQAGQHLGDRSAFIADLIHGSEEGKPGSGKWEGHVRLCTLPLGVGTCVYVHVQACVYEYMHVYMHVYICVCACMCVVIGPQTMHKQCHD